MWENQGRSFRYSAIHSEAVPPDQSLPWMKGCPPHGTFSIGALRRERYVFGASCLLCVGWRPALQTPKTTRVPVDGITSVFGIAMCTAMIMFTPEQCMGMM